MPKKTPKPTVDASAAGGILTIALDDDGLIKTKGLDGVTAFVLPNGSPRVLRRVPGTKHGWLSTTSDPGAVKAKEVRLVYYEQRHGGAFIDIAPKPSQAGPLGYWPITR